MLGKYVVQIEIVGACNLKCPSCAVGNYEDGNKLGSIGGIMHVEQFERIIKKLTSELNHSTSDVYIALYSWGEPLIHPYIDKLIAIAKRHGFKIGVSSNLNVAKHLDKCLSSGPDEFVVSLSGHKQDTYSISHAGGNIELVKSNMQLLAETIEKYKLNTKVFVNYHCYRHNVGDDIVLMANYCEKLKFTFMPTIAYYTPVENMLKFSDNLSGFRGPKILDYLLIDIEEQIKISRRNADNQHCDLITSRLDIDRDGAVKLCCASFDRRSNVSENFFEIKFDDILSKRLDSALCSACSKNGFERIYTLKDYAQWTDLANKTLSKINSPLRFSNEGYTISGHSSESALLYETIKSMNSGDLTSALSQSINLNRLIKEKYNFDCADSSEILKSILEDKNSRGVNIPIDPLNILFVQAVLELNYHNRPAAAKLILNHMTEIHSLLQSDAGYSTVASSMKETIEAWICATER